MQNIEQIRENILLCYGLDINEATSFFSTKNYAFVFPNKPTMIRVSINGYKDRSATLSEALWLDDLKDFGATVCDPFPSKNNRLVEEFQVGDESYRISMFRTAKGSVRNIADVDPMHMITVGDCLGRIHAAGANALENGIKFCREQYSDTFDRLISLSSANLPPEVKARAEDVSEKIKNLPKDPHFFGMIHGDFHTANFFADGNNVWVFDFDECAYGFFMYDIATVCLMWAIKGYNLKSGKGCRKVLYEDILPYFRIGYELHMKFPEEHWDLFDLFFTHRTILTAMSLLKLTKTSTRENINDMTEFFLLPLSYDDVTEGFDAILARYGQFISNAKPREKKT